MSTDKIALSKLTKPEALAELKELEVDVDFGDDAYSEDSSVKDLRELVKEGREIIAEDAEDGKGSDDEDEDEDEDDDDDDGESEERLKSEEHKDPDKVKTEPKEADYLRQYQFKKINGNAVVGGVQTDPDEGSKAEVMKKFLLGQDRIKVMIPVEAGSSSVIPFSVTLNGYRLDLPRNVYFEVPEQVAIVVMDSQNQQSEALKPYRLDPENLDKAMTG